MGRRQSLKAKLLVGVLALVVGSGSALALLVSQRYALSLRNESSALAHNLAQAAALQAADMILINDLVALQKMLDQHLESHASLGYLFIVREGEVLAHTFPQGLPRELLRVNQVRDARPNLQEVRATTGQTYLDVAWPIFEGRAGDLRLGLSLARSQGQLSRLWWEISGLVLAILVLALGAALGFIARLTRPLEALAGTVQRLDAGEVGVRAPVGGQDEVGRLAAAFNHMVARAEEYTQRLEQQAAELRRANLQTRSFCEIVQGLGSLGRLTEVGAFLIRRLGSIAPPGPLAVLLTTEEREALYCLTEAGAEVHRRSEIVQAVLRLLEAGRGQASSGPVALPSPPLPAEFAAAPGQVLLPLVHEGQVLGGAVLAQGPAGADAERELRLLRLILDQAAGVLRRAVAHEEEVQTRQRRDEGLTSFAGLIGKDRKMRVVYDLIQEVAPSEATVLIQGESGTGKELAAWAIHQTSPRRDRPFVVINCSAYPQTLLESEIFGHERGAFTGAARQRAGRFEQAHGGTIFLDEVSEIPLPAQIKLLRVLQSQKFERLGGEKTLVVDVRVLAATNKDLPTEVKAGRFREDLFYRLNVIPILLPPLRERRNDVPLLARHFLARFAAEQGQAVKELSPDALRLLLEHAWPGNVRELENTIEHATVLAKGGLILPGDLPASLRAPGPPPARAMEEQERRLVLEILTECGWNKKRAAQRLGISRSTLYDKLKKFGLQGPLAH